MSDDATSNVIEVSGRGIVTRPPELAEFRIEINASGDDPAELAQRVVIRHNNVLEALSAQLTDDEITAHGPVVRRHDQLVDFWLALEDQTPPREPAFDCASEIWVRTERLDILGLLMSAAMSAGASTVSTLSFEVKDPTEMMMEAVAVASEAARLRAQTIAKALGRRLGPPIQLSSRAMHDWSEGMAEPSARSIAMVGTDVCRASWDGNAPTIIPSEIAVHEVVRATFTLLEPED